MFYDMGQIGDPLICYGQCNVKLWLVRQDSFVQNIGSSLVENVSPHISENIFFYMEQNAGIPLVDCIWLYKHWNIEILSFLTGKKIGLVIGSNALNQWEASILAKPNL